MCMCMCCVHVHVHVIAHVYVHVIAHVHVHVHVHVHAIACELCVKSRLHPANYPVAGSAPQHPLAVYNFEFIVTLEKTLNNRRAATHFLICLQQSLTTPYLI
jgi:hypothetical protein